VIVREHRRDDLITKMAPVNYDPAAPCPQYLAFLNKVCAGNADLIGFLQRLGGYCLAGSTSERVLVFFWGTGHNGKTTLLETWRGLLGDYAATTPISTLMVKCGGEGIPNDIARLAGVRLVIAAEGEAGQHLAESLVKRLTGGDTLVARYLHREFFEFEPQFKILVATNHKPVIRGVDNAIWGRVRLVPFTVEIPEAERIGSYHKHLLATEASGILNWMLEGCRRWQREGLGTPPEVRTATDTWRQEMDRLGEFFAAGCVVLDPAAKTSSGDLYRVYVRWCETANQHPVSQTVFGTELGERGYPAHESHGVRYRLGLRLTDGWAKWVDSLRAAATAAEGRRMPWRGEE
jgi:putative DNA primase/helicase